MSVFIQAHQDDWQGNMGARAWDDLEGLNAANKMLFIYVTAGDAESGSKDSRYFLARENGARASVRHVLKKVFNRPWHEEELDKASCNHHLVRAVAVKNATSIFLRLPDIGDGRPSSIEQLRGDQHVSSFGDKETGTVSTEYVGWLDLVSTVVDAIRQFAFDGNVLWLNAIANNEYAGHRDHQWVAEVTNSAALLIAKLNPETEVKIQWWQGSDRRVVKSDGGIASRIALLEAYDSHVLDAFPDGSHCTFAEPLVISRQLLLQEIPGEETEVHGRRKP